MWKLLIYCKVEVKSPAFVHAFIGLDSKHEVEYVIRVRKLRLPGLAWLKFCKIWGVY